MEKHEDEIFDGLETNILDYDKVKDKIFYRLINAKRYEERLCECPHRMIEDLALVYDVRNCDKKHKAYTITIDDSILARWKIDEDKLHKQAEKNTIREFPAVCTKCCDILGSSDVVSGIMYMVSNKDCLLGAVAMLYPGFLNYIANYWNSDLVIIPSSVHEVILIPNAVFKKSPTFFSDIIVEMNSTIEDKKDILSDHPYLYLKEQDRIISWEENNGKEKS